MNWTISEMLQYIWWLNDELDWMGWLMAPISFYENLDGSYNREIQLR